MIDVGEEGGRDDVSAMTVEKESPSATAQKKSCSTGTTIRTDDTSMSGSEDDGE